MAQDRDVFARHDGPVDVELAGRGVEEDPAGVVALARRPGREIGQQPKVLIAAQPTWGVDVGASAQIRQALIDLRDNGVAVLVISEELDELMEICDRLAVIAQGRLSAPKSVHETTAEEIGMLMAGARPAAGQRTAPALV